MEGGVKNGQKNADVINERPLITSSGQQLLWLDSKYCLLLLSVKNKETPWFDVIHLQEIFEIGKYLIFYIHENVFEGQAVAVPLDNVYNIAE